MYDSVTTDKLWKRFSCGEFPQIIEEYDFWMILVFETTKSSKY